MFKFLSISRKKLKALGLTSEKKQENHNFFFQSSCVHPENIIDTVLHKTNVKHVFQTRRRRGVFCAEMPDGKEIIVKQYFLWRHKRDCFHVDKFGIAEISAKKIFDRSKFILPEIYGYYEKRICGLPVECGIIMEFLSDFYQIMPQDKLLAVKVIVDLHRAGIYHRDLNTKNILRNHNQDIALIDYSGKNYSPEETLHYLLRMTGCFLYSTAFMYPEMVDQEYRQETGHPA